MTPHIPAKAFPTFRLVLLIAFSFSGLAFQGGKARSGTQVNCEKVTLSGQPGNVYSVYPAGNHTKVDGYDSTGQQIASAMVDITAGADGKPTAKFWQGGGNPVKGGSHADIVAAANACLSQHAGDAPPPPPSVQTPVPMQTAVQPVETKAAAKVNDDGSVVVRVANLKMGSPGEVTITPEVDKNGHPIGGVHFKLKITHAGTAVGEVTDTEEWTFEGAATEEETGKGKKTRHFLGGGLRGVLDSQNTNQDAAIFVCNDPEKCFNVSQSAMGDKRKNEIGSDGSVMSGFKAFSGKTPPKFTMMAGTAAALVDAWNKGKDALLSYIAGGGKSPIDPKDPRIGKEILALQGTAAKFGITAPVSAPQ